MSRKLHTATSSRDTERGLGNNPGTGTPRQNSAAPNMQRKGATSANEGVRNIEEDMGKTGKKKASPGKK